jgi:hypothetical protein
LPVYLSSAVFQELQLWVEDVTRKLQQAIPQTAAAAAAATTTHNNKNYNSSSSTAPLPQLFPIRDACT